MRHAARAEAGEDQGEHGIVLVTALILVALLGVALATALWLLRAELWAAGSARAYVQARYTAEAGVHHALALLAPGTGFGPLLAGAAGLADPDRPGPLLEAGGDRIPFPGPPFGYEVTVVAETPDALGRARIVLRSRGTAVRAAERLVLATVAREEAAYAPAALSLAGGALSVSGTARGAPGAPAVTLEAGDPASEPPPPAGSPLRSRGALGATSDAALAAAVATASEAHVALLGGTPTRLVRAFDIAAFVASTGLSTGAAATLAAGVGGGGAPGVARVDGGMAARLAGAGAVLSDGDLEITGEVDFSGALFVGGALRLSGAPCRIRGTIWARDVIFAAPCAVRLDHGAVDAADAVVTLPRRAVLRSLADANG